MYSLKHTQQTEKDLVGGHAIGYGSFTFTGDPLMTTALSMAEDSSKVVFSFVIILKSFTNLHVVHWNSDKYPSFVEAAHEPDGLAVLGVFLQIGEPNSQLQKIIDILDSIKEKLGAPNNGAEQSGSEQINVLSSDPFEDKSVIFSGGPTFLAKSLWVTLNHEHWITELKFNTGELNVLLGQGAMINFQRS
ncbi:hypothetical protein P7K49_026989 [Saguinus oedipus]|uniref:Alpha-carbonic anhydrase domain-containing protein n=1 Tax=Saguinus oedipus TaxID=9490 RepID=A0ABQ9UG92_SAGOE|nr:hypothetical protein P7K49_026989 [Saguinus oedipus]